MLEFNEDLIAYGLAAGSAEEVIHALASKMHLQGLVASDYGRQTWDREQIHPTGLPTQPFCIAFPHADAEGVNRSALCVAVLGHPVTFKNMGDPDEDLQVEVVFMLANRDPESQIETLRNLAILFGQPQKLVELRDQTSLRGVESWLRRELRLGEGHRGLSGIEKEEDEQ